MSPFFRPTALFVVVLLQPTNAFAQSAEPKPRTPELAAEIPDGTWRYEFTHTADEITPDTWRECLTRIQKRGTSMPPDALRAWTSALEQGIAAGKGQTAEETKLEGVVSILGDDFYWETTELGGWGSGVDGAGSYRVLSTDGRCVVRSMFHGFDEDFYIDQTPAGLQAQLQFVALWDELLAWKAALAAHGDADANRALISYEGRLEDLDGVKAPPWFAITVERVVLRVLDIPGRPRTETVTLFDAGGGVVMQYASEWRGDTPESLSRSTYLPFMTTLYDAVAFRVLESGAAVLPTLETIALTPVAAERVIDRTRMKLSLPVDLVLRGDEAIDAEIEARLVRRDPTAVAAEEAATAAKAASEPAPPREAMRNAEIERALAAATSTPQADARAPRTAELGRIGVALLLGLLVGHTFGRVRGKGVVHAA